MITNPITLSQKLRSMADALDALLATSNEIMIEVANLAPELPMTETVAAPIHWTRRPENKAKLLRIRRKAARTRVASVKVAKSAKTRAANAKLHWTQRPANKLKVLRMNRKSAKEALAVA
jgi:hypothetical protein